MKYKKPGLTVDGVIFDEDMILLIKRKNEPFKNKWAIPGGYVEYGETVEDAVIREIKEETNLNANINCLIGVYSDPKRDPRGHTITIAFLLNVKNKNYASGDDAIEAKFFKLGNLPELSFDHEKIIDDAIKKR